MISQDIIDSNPGYLSDLPKFSSNQYRKENDTRSSESDEIQKMISYGEFIDLNYRTPTHFEIKHMVRLR